MADDYAVAPAHTSRTSCRRAVLAADFTDTVPAAVEQVRRERSGSASRRVRFTYTDDVLNRCRPHTTAYSDIARNRVAGCNEWIRAVVDVEHDTLCTFKEDFAVFPECIIQYFCRICNVRCQTLRRFFIWFIYFIKCESVTVIQCFERMVLYPEVLLMASSECYVVDQIRHADADPLYVVYIARSYATFCRADLIFTARFLFQLILKKVIGQDDLRTV